MVVRPLPSLYNYQGLCTITILLYIISIFPLAVVYYWSPRVERIRLYSVVSKVTTAQILHTTYYHTLRNSVLEGSLLIILHLACTTNLCVQKYP